MSVNIQRNKIIPAAFLILKKGKQVLLLRRANTGYEDGNYSLISGHVEKGETFSQAVIREAREEANINIHPKNLKVNHIMHRKTDKKDPERIDVFFVCDKWSGEVENNEPQKCTDLSWFDINNLPQNTINYVKKVLNESDKEIHYFEFGWENTNFA